MFPYLIPPDTSGDKCVVGRCRYAFRSDLRHRNDKRYRTGAAINARFNVGLNDTQKYLVCPSCRLKIDKFLKSEYAKSTDSDELEDKPESYHGTFRINRRRSGIIDLSLTGISTIEGQEPVLWDDIQTSFPALLRKGEQASRSKKKATTTTLQVLEGKTSIADLPGYRVKCSSIVLLFDGYHLPADVMEAAIYLLITRHNTDRKSIKKFQSVSLRYLTTEDETAYYSTQPYYEPDPKFKTKTLIMPVKSHGHFWLIILNVPGKLMTVLDSSWHYIEVKKKDPGYRTSYAGYVLNDLFKVKSFCKVQNCVKPDECKDKWHYCEERACVQQKDDFTCGFYVYYYISNIIKEQYAKNMETVADVNLRNIQCEIAESILSTCHLGKKLLNALYMYD